MIGTAISHYKILEKLGEGGMGVVYKAQDVTLDRVVALKFLPLEIAVSEEERGRFLQEARAAATLNHPHVCTIHGLEEAEGRQFIQMEYVEGETLRAKLLAGPLKTNEAIEYAVQIAEALEEAHGKGVVHRDIKPENIMVNARRQVKVMDFGLAKLKGMRRLTQASSTIGTLAYMAPEQIQGGEVDARSDIFSFGSLLYEMLSGEGPFRGEHEAAVMYSILNEEPSGLSEIPAEIQHILNRALEKEPEDRYQAAHEMLIDLRRVKRDSARISRKLPVPRPHREARLRVPRLHFSSRQTAIGAGLLGLIFVVVILLLTVFSGGGPAAGPVPIAVISFENQTGDPAYDYLRDAIPNLLITSLEQSPSIRVMSWDRMRDILRQMGRNDVTVVDRELGFQVCRRDTVPFIVLGSFTKGGNIFATDVKLIDVERKSTVKSASSRGEGAESILQGQIDELSEQIAEGVGLSVPLLTKTSRPVAEVTTTSLEAYESYLRGREAYRRYEDAKARELLEAALVLDSTFAEACYWLASNLNNLGLIRERDGRIRQALRHAGKANDVDRLYIEAAYARFIEKDYDKRARIFEAILERAPSDPRAHLVLGNHFCDREPARARRYLLEGLRLDSTNSEFLNMLGYVELNTGNFEKALGYFQQYVARSPESPNPYDSMGEIYFRMGWLDNALEYFLKAVEVQPGFSDSYFRAAYVCALREDYDQVWTLVDRGEATAPSVAIEAWGEFSRAFYRYWLGQPGKAAGHLAQVKLLAKQAGSLHWGTVPLLFEARLALDRDEVDRSRALMNEWLGLVLDDTNPEYDAFRKMVYLAMQGLCDVQSGRSSRAWLRVDSMRTISPQVRRDRVWAEWTCNQLIAEMLLGAGRYEECLSLCDSLRPAVLEYLYPAQIMLYNTPFQGDLKARALVRKGELERAIAEYERLIRFESRSDNRRLVNPLYRYRLGVLYQEEGETEKAIEQLRRFVSLWSKAEADQPELPDAKKRLIVLRGTPS